MKSLPKGTAYIALNDIIKALDVLLSESEGELTKLLEQARDTVCRALEHVPDEVDLDLCAYLDAVTQHAMRIKDEFIL